MHVSRACLVRVQLVGWGEKMRQKRIKLRSAETATKSLVIKLVKMPCDDFVTLPTRPLIVDTGEGNKIN